VIERAREHRSARLVSEFNLENIDLGDDTVGTDIATDALELLTADDLAEGLAAAVPRGFRVSPRGGAATTGKPCWAVDERRG
jgi:hypothetical protein